MAGSDTALYRHFDKAGTLLYVGISLNAVARLAQHRQSAHWFREIARIEVEWHQTRAMAEAAEIHAIQTECPAHNITHSIDPALIALLDSIGKAHMVGKDGRILPEYVSLTAEESDDLADRL